MFAYLGRRGLSRFAYGVARAALADERLTATIMVSRQNEIYDAFSELGDAHLAVDTFESNAGAILQAWRISPIRRQLTQHIWALRPEVFIELMPHVWSSFIAPVVKAAGVRYVCIVHDASNHPGDYRSGRVAFLTRRTLWQADTILTLSGEVAGRVRPMIKDQRTDVVPLFHPDLDFGACCSVDPPQSGEPIRLAFFGRIMPYKGLPLFLDMVDELRRQGIAVDVGVFGEGELGSCRARLEAMRAEVINRWLTEDEIAAVLPRYHAIVASHVEASQSGVVATAFGAGLPVIATPVGGLIEQVRDGISGVLAARADAFALAEAARRLLLNPGLYRSVRHNIVTSKGDRSMAQFVRECVSQALQAG